MKSGFVTLVGRPNVGKSTLVNRLVGQKVAIVSDRPQTTLAAIRGVRTTQSSQIVFVDTPGLHRPRTLLVWAAVLVLVPQLVMALPGVTAAVRSALGQPESADAIREFHAAGVDDYRFAKRIPSRSAAIRQLLQRGMSPNIKNTEQGSRHCPD